MEFTKVFDIDLNFVNIPSQPLVVVMDKEVWETDSIRGIICILIPEYIDSEDRTDDWILRIKFARKIAMLSLSEGKNVDVFDKKKGIIKNNFSSAEDDDDYLEDDDLGESQLIEVSNEVEFLESLIKLGVIKILQREDSTYFTQEKIECSKCSHRLNGECNVYKNNIFIDDCDSVTSGNINKYNNGRYEYIIIND